MAIVALNFAALRALYFDFRTPSNANRLDLQAMGVLPMTTLLSASRKNRSTSRAGRR
jgi:hypothetical protein